MAFEDLFTGLNMFKQGVQEYSTTKAIGEATDQLNQLNQSAASDQEKRVAQMQMGSQLALHLQALGAPQAQIAGATKEIKPIDYSNPNDMYMSAMLQGKAPMAAQAQAMQKTMVTDPAEKIAAQHQAYALQQIDRTSKNKYEVALLKASAKGDVKEHPMPATLVEKINSFDEGLHHINSMRDMVSNNDNLVGPIDARLPFKDQFKDQSEFKIQFNQFRNDYVHQMTGAGMTDKEAERYFNSTVKPEMNADVFMNGLDRLQKITEGKRQIHIKNATDFGFTTGQQGTASKQQAAAPASSQQQQQAKSSYTDPKTGITWEGYKIGNKFQATKRVK